MTRQRPQECEAQTQPTWGVEELGTSDELARALPPHKRERSASQVPSENELLGLQQPVAECSIEPQIFPFTLIPCSHWRSATSKKQALGA